MGGQWKNQAKSQNASAKGAMIHKIVKEITVASKMGGPVPDNNPRLRAALELARKNSVKKDTIDHAIKKGAGLLDEEVHYETVLFEGFAPHQVAIIVECLTDNRNRTNSEVRVLFKKGTLGAPGSVMWQFDHVGLIEATAPDTKLDAEEVAIEAGAQGVEALPPDELGHQAYHFTCELTDLNHVNKYLTEKGWKISTSEPGYVAKNTTELNDSQKKEVLDFLHSMDENDDVHRVYAALK